MQLHLRYLDLCAGAGGASLGLRRAGLQPVGHYERDAYAARAVALGMGEPVEPVDLLTLDGADLPEAEVWWASPPCQPFSASGKRLGRTDARNLYPTVLRLLDEARNAGRAAAWLLLENVVGLTQHAKPTTRRRKAGTRAWCPQLGGAGPCAGCYWHDEVLPALRARFPHVAVRVIDCADLGLPQNRRRVITVCGPTPYVWPTLTHAAEAAPLAGLQQHVSMAEALGLEPGVMVEGGGRNPGHAGDTRRTRDLTDRPSTTIAAQRPNNNSPRVTPAWWHRESSPAGPSRTIGTSRNASVTVWGNTDADRPAPTVDANEVKGSTMGRTGQQRVNRASVLLHLQTGRRRLTVAECATLQGFPTDWPWQGNKTQQYRQVGNAVPPILAEALGRSLTTHHDPR